MRASADLCPIPIGCRQTQTNRRSSGELRYELRHRPALLFPHPSANHAAPDVLPISAILASATGPDPSLWMLLPFALLLASIACGPLLAPKFWKHHFRKVSLGLGAIAVASYVFVLRAPMRMAHVGWEYVSFIVFIGALFVAAGGIHVAVKGEATPLRNCLYLATGAMIANLLGTTGASMLLIRPWIRMNRYRFTMFHGVFFIFIVSNVGGCLTPVGDPPLFLGYLNGVPFFWVTEKCWPAWLLAVAVLLAIFFVLDARNFLRAPKPVRDAETAHERFRINGLANFGWLAMILGAVFIKEPAGVREALMVAAAAGSYFTTNRAIHEANHFSFAPIAEVAWLFLGIFATMVPALDYLQHHAAQLGLSLPEHFYWSSGFLSAVLDNAPTYLAFLTVATAQHGVSLDDPAGVVEFLGTHGPHVVAISLGAVFFGAMTYIGNGPNFMVKAICDHAKVRTPGFFGYIARFSLPILLPVLALVAWFQFRR